MPDAYEGLVFAESETGREAFIPLRPSEDDGNA